MICKCIDCSQRKVGCHDACEDYARYKAYVDYLRRKTSFETESRSREALAALKRKEYYMRHKLR